LKHLPVLAPSAVAWHRSTYARVHLAPLLVVALLMLANVALVGTMAMRRHQNLRTNALDLGYTDQAVWNTLNGRPFRFSTYLDAAFQLDIPIQDFREPGVLLGYHVEPLLAAISLLYLLHDGPETLLWLQSVAIALGAVPVYLIAHNRFGGEASGLRNQGTPRVKFGVLRWLPVAFVLLYLLSPSLQAANMSDFHAVALSPVLLLAAFYFLETGRPWGFAAFALLATMTKEEIGLIVAMMGLWAAFARRRWVVGLGVAVFGAGWSFLSFQVILPHFNGLGSSAFLVRYGQFGDSPGDILRNVLPNPGLLSDWLRRPDVLRYLRDLWLSSGGLAILYPFGLMMALPSLALNLFSRYDWMHSGGGHYSVAIVPFLVISAIYGVDWLAKKAGKWEEGRSGIRQVRQTVAVVLIGVGLVVLLVHHYYNGILPFSRRFALEPVSEHARRAEPFIEQVNALPPDVPISASTGLYPHVAHRQKAYLFPTVSDAEFILLDVTGSPSPGSVGDRYQIVRELLDYAQFGVARSDHGLLLLERGLDNYRLAPTFYDAFLGSDARPQVPLGADFGGLLRFQGFDWNVRPVVRPEQVVEIVTYWKALSPLEENYRLVFYFWDEADRLVWIQAEEQIVQWYPTWLWNPGQVVKVALPPLPVGDLAHVGVGVLAPGAKGSDIEGRIVPIIPLAGQDLALWEQDTILELTKP
jgi:uncharacterized membrane protein